MDWNGIIDEDSLAALLPGRYAQYARPVKEGLVVFLTGLPRQIQESIAAEQAALPLGATLSERLGRLARSCPSLHKLGQVLARNQHLAAELRDELRPLESLPPSVSLETVQSALATELGPLENYGICVTGPPLAEASVAVVVGFRTQRAGSPREGVFKILKPGIEERLELELEQLSNVGTHLDEKCDELSIPKLDYRDAFEQVRDKLQSELRLDREQEHLATAAKEFAGDRDVQIPTLFQCCTSRVTAMERVYGLKVTDHWHESAADKRRLAEIVARALVAKPVFSRDGTAMFHADPHAGNLIYTYDRRLAILDWSLVGHLGESERAALAQIVLSTMTIDAARIASILESLDIRGQVDRFVLRGAVDAAMRRIRKGQVPGLSWLVGMLDEAVQFAGLRVAPDLMMFRKSLLTLEGVVDDLGADRFRMDDLIAREFAIRFAMEWPERIVSLPTSREYATRLSNFDLAAALLSMPLGMARYWQAQWQDALHAAEVATE